MSAVRAVLVLAAGCALAAPAAAQNLRDVTLRGYSVHACNNSPGSERRVPDCNGDYKIYFSPKGLIYYHWYGAGATGLVFEVGKTRTVTTQAGAQRFPVRTQARFDGQVLTLNFSFDVSDRWPSGEPQRHRWNAGLQIALGGASGCTIVGADMSKYLSMGPRILEDYTTNPMRDQNCWIEQGRK